MLKFLVGIIPAGLLRRVILSCARTYMYGLKTALISPMSPLTRVLGIWLALVASCCVGIFFACCASEGKTSSSRFAFVKIQGNTPGQICDVATQVFHARGYEGTRSDLSHMVFEKKATGMSNLTYGNWGDGPPLTLRVKADILPDGEQTYLLECQAYMVRDKGGSLEEEIKMGKMKNGPFQALLDEVENRLRGPAAPP